MKNLTKLTAFVLALTFPVQAFAAAVTGTRASLQRTLDANGNPIGIESDRPWKVFEVISSQSETQVTDEDGKTPTTGVLHKACLESGPAIVQNNDWLIIWDSSAATGTAALGRRLLPPLMRASAAASTAFGTQALRCTEVMDAIFTKGLRALQGQSTGVGTSYIYWRDLGGRR